MSHATVNVTVNETTNAITVALAADDLSDNFLSQLSDVTGTPTDNQVLRFDTGTSKWSPTTETVESVNAAVGVVVLTTTNIAEGTNLYYTNSRADARITAADTDDLSEGSTNLYYTNTRADARITAANTGDLSEGSNLYYTDARADARVTPAAVSDEANTSTGSFIIPTGTTAQRPGTPTTGMIRFNSDTSRFEGYNGTAWVPIDTLYS